MSHLSRQTVEAQLAGADPAAVPKVHELLAGPIEAILRDASLGKAARAAALQQVQCREMGGYWDGAASWQTWANRECMQIQMATGQAGGFCCMPTHCYVV